VIAPTESASVQASSLYIRQLLPLVHSVNQLTTPRRMRIAVDPLCNAIVTIDR